MEPIAYVGIFVLIMIGQGFLSLRQHKAWGFIIPFILLSITLYIAIATITNYHSSGTSFPLGSLIFLNTAGYTFPMATSIIIYFVCRAIKRKLG